MAAISAIPTVIWHVQRALSPAKFHRRDGPAFATPLGPDGALRSLTSTMTDSTDSKVATDTVMDGDMDEAELARMGYKQELR